MAWSPENILKLVQFRTLYTEMSHTIHEIYYVAHNENGVTPPLHLQTINKYMWELSTENK